MVVGYARIIIMPSIPTSSYTPNYMIIQLIFDYICQINWWLLSTINWTTKGNTSHLYITGSLWFTINMYLCIPVFTSITWWWLLSDHLFECLVIAAVNDRWYDDIYTVHNNTCLFSRHRHPPLLLPISILLHKNDCVNSHQCKEGTVAVIHVAEHDDDGPLPHLPRSRNLIRSPKLIPYRYI